MTYALVLKFNKCHDAKDGEFCESSGGASSKEKAPKKSAKSKPAPKASAKSSAKLPATVKVSTTQEPIEPVEKSALDQYSLSQYASINKMLRGQEKEDWMDWNHTKTLIAPMDSAIKKATVNEDTTVYRGVSKTRLEEMVEGAILMDQGYASSTAKLSVANTFAKRHGGAVVQIKVPKGGHLLDMDKATGRKTGESEHLFPRGTRYRVVSNKGGSVILEVVSYEATPG